MLDARDMVGLCERAGALALEHYRRSEPERKADRSFVTAADREVESFLREESGRLAPGLGFLGEEGASRPSEGRFTLVVDPIDGTGSFLDELPTWCVSVGLCRDGKPVAGVIHLPAIGETYTAGEDGLTWNGRPVEPPDATPVGSQSRILVTSSSHRRFEISFPGKIRSLGSTAYHMALVARGMAVGALLGRPRAWDLAAGVAILRAVGGEVLDLDGGPLDFPDLMDKVRPDRPLAACARGYREDILGTFREVVR
jgi:myo-inositol-1(or 4)-monophosphatase